MLTPAELERYARHIVLREVGGPGQAALKRSRVLVVGAGGIGAPVLHYLAAAGIGTLGIVDDDLVSLSNLQRQVIYTGDDIGQPKALRAAAHLEALNPHVTCVPHVVRLTPDNAATLIGPCDLVLDGSDKRLHAWIEESGVAAIAADNYAVEGLGDADPQGRGPLLPLHELCLFKLGIPLGELWHLSPLNAWLKKNGRCRFLLTAPPLRLTGAVGSPVTPIATV